jgi:DNA polymerase III epsilon subunit family exonuclease
MTMLSETKLVFLDVETTGLSPAMGDRVIELGMITCQGATEITRSSHLINPGRLIPWDAQQVHGISDQDVAECPPFKEIAEEIKSTLVDSWVVGHNVRFDTGFLTMELQQAGSSVAPLGCLDTCQLASALWDFPNYKLETVVKGLKIPTTRLHRALDDATVTREVFHRVVEELGGWDSLTIDDLLRLHRYQPTWSSDSKADLPKPLYDALTNGSSLSIRYVNAEGLSSFRVIRPETSFASGRYTYIRAFCEKSSEVRKFRLDRIIVE